MPMATEPKVTNAMLLQFMQGVKEELIHRIDAVEVKLRKEMKEGFAKVDRQLEEAKQHRQALQEDLEVTISMQAKQQKQLASLSR